MEDLMQSFVLAPTALGHLTSAVQFGFITGTLIFAFFTIADRYSPSKVFFTCAILGALANLGAVWDHNSFGSLFTFRFITGLFLAGIYPVGMKIAADYFQKDLGKSLGLLVGALVVGTALPHLIKNFFSDLNWKLVILFTSAIALIGGCLMYMLVPDGPYRRPNQSLNFRAFFQVFQQRDFRAAAFGYFGHMWELYTFWAFIPVMLFSYQHIHKDGIDFNIPLIAFLVIGLGGLACAIGGLLSVRYGPKKIAAMALTFSGLCCLISPLAMGQNNPALFLVFLIFWGLVVVADSPLFSTMVANNANPEYKGTALTIVNCIGFSITIISLQIMVIMLQTMSPKYAFLILSIGPALGLWALGSGTRFKHQLKKSTDNLS
jgi:MFS family permease